MRHAHAQWRTNGSWFMIMTGTTLYNRLKDFLECEGKSCSFDPELITPEYVFRMWGGAVAIEDIATAMEEVRRRMKETNTDCTD